MPSDLREAALAVCEALERHQERAWCWICGAAKAVEHAPDCSFGALRRALDEPEESEVERLRERGEALAEATEDLMEQARLAMQRDGGEGEWAIDAADAALKAWREVAPPVSRTEEKPHV